MANAFGAYDPIFYAQEALAWLRMNLGFGERVYRGYDKAPQSPGSVITIRRPMTFTATAMPATPTDLTPDSVSITLNQWWGDTVQITDKELAYTKAQILEEHIKPMAYAVAFKIDATLAGLFTDIPYTQTPTSPLAVADITAARKTLSLNQAPLNDGRLHLGLSPTLMKEALDLQAFSQWQGAGQIGAGTQATGQLGMKYGFEVFENQNVQTFTSGVSADSVGALTANAAIGATVISFNAVTIGGTFNAGDWFTIAGDTQKYSFTGGPYTADGTGLVASANITPPLKVAHTTTQVITITLDGAGVGKEISLAFHRDAFALAMGVLPDSLPGIEVATVTDASSGLSIRARRWAEGSNAKLFMGLDALWGVKTLNSNLAVRLWR